jgi:hypothetical protein
MTLPQFLGMSDHLLHGFQASSTIWLHSLPEDFALRTKYNKDADSSAQGFQEKMTTGTLTIQDAAREASIAPNKEVIAFRKDTSALSLLYVTSTAWRSRRRVGATTVCSLRQTVDGYRRRTASLSQTDTVSPREDPSTQKLRVR